MNRELQLELPIRKETKLRVVKLTQLIYTRVHNGISAQRGLRSGLRSGQLNTTEFLTPSLFFHLQGLLTDIFADDSAIDNRTNPYRKRRDWKYRRVVSNPYQPMIQKNAVLVAPYFEKDAIQTSAIQGLTLARQSEAKLRFRNKTRHRSHKKIWHEQ